MHPRALVLAVGIFSFSCAVGCAAEAGELLNDSAETSSNLQVGAADAAASSTTYYVGRPDFRRCAWPHCGGIWVHRANRTTTRCPDGHYASECYVTQLDASALGLSSDQQSNLSSAFSGAHAIVTGSIQPASTGSITYSVLRASSAWEAANDATSAELLYALDDAGIRCVRAPCFSIDEHKLNSTIARTLSDLDFRAVGLTDAQRLAVGRALSGAGMLAAGHNVRDPRSGALTIVATQAYFPVLPLPTTCSANADCTLTFYPTAVTSAADCYCPGCPSPALVGTASANQASWTLYCSATHGIDVCPARPCAPPPPAACTIAGTCGFGAPEI